MYVQQLIATVTILSGPGKVKLCSDHAHKT